jgi:hypothetical protein
MNMMVLRRTAAIVAVSVTLGGHALAEKPRHMKLTGLIHDYTPALDPSGAWQVMGEWSLSLHSGTGKVDFIASLNMVRSEDPTRAAHTHHMRVSDGQVTALPNGFRISGTGIFTSNGNLAGFSGSPVAIDISGSGAVPFANVAITVGADAAAHFGAEPLNGVVTLRRAS